MSKKIELMLESIMKQNVATTQALTEVCKCLVSLESKLSNEGKISGKPEIKNEGKSTSSTKKSTRTGSSNSSKKNTTPAKSGKGKGKAQTSSKKKSTKGKGKTATNTVSDFVRANPTCTLAQAKAKGFKGETSKSLRTFKKRLGVYLGNK